MRKMRQTVRANLFVGRVRPGVEEKDQMPDVRKHECGPADFRHSGKDREEKLSAVSTPPAGVPTHISVSGPGV
jgi:hypothetical protein